MESTVQKLKEPRFFWPLLLLCIVLVAGCGSKQQGFSKQTPVEQCLLTIDELPPLRRFKLGMTREEIGHLLPELPSKLPNDLGWERYLIEGTNKSRVRINPVPEADYLWAALDDERQPDLKGVQVRLELIDGHLSLIKVFYLTGETWDSREEFVAHIKQSFHLQGKWQDIGVRAGTLACRDFLVFAGIGLDPIAERVWKESRDANSVAFAISDSAPTTPFIMFMALTYNPVERKIKKEAEQKQKQKQKEEEDRKEFKP
jgi:hypothetical protein